MYSAEEKIKWFALTSRIFTFILQAVANYLIEDHKPGVFTKPSSPTQHSGQEGHILDVLTSGLTRWDAQYFLHIAEYGYTYENTLAFFPLLPLILRWLAYPFQLVANNAFQAAAVPCFLSSHHALVLIAVLVNNLLFVYSALLLHKLTLRLTKNHQLAYITALIFCVNPASIFFSAVYSESVFTFITLTGFLYVESGQLGWASLLFGLSSMARSNGLVNAGFIAHRIMKTRTTCLSIGLAVIVLCCCVILAVMPFAMYQFYCYTKFCVAQEPKLADFIIEHAARNSYKIPGGSKSEWCNHEIPLAYSYIQKHHWNVGFLQYYEIKQIPNFALAFPVLALAVFGVVTFVRLHGASVIFTLGFAAGSPQALLPAACFPYILHLLFLTVFSAFFMHVQVSTRLIFSSSPAIYWICASIILKNMSVSKEEAIAKRLSKCPHPYFEPLWNTSSRWKTCIITERFLNEALLVRYYFFAYFLAGPVIFSNYLPWT